jgi:hypothetical protein
VVTLRDIETEADFMRLAAMPEVSAVSTESPAATQRAEFRKRSA